MSTLAQRLPAVRALRSTRVPAWLRHASWFAAWGLLGFTVTMVLVGW